MHDAARGTMRARLVLGVVNVALIAGWHGVLLAATYLATQVLRCHLLFGHQPGGCEDHPFVFAAIAVGGGVLGMSIALAWRARVAAYWWAVLAAFNTVGAVWYLRAGIVDVPRYGATQSAMLMAATFSVVLAAIMGATPWTAPSVPSRHRLTAHLITGTIGFAMADALIRMRDRPLMADDVNHSAVLASAVLAAILMGLIGRHGARLHNGDTHDA